MSLSVFCASFLRVCHGPYCYYYYYYYYFHPLPYRPTIYRPGGLKSRIKNKVVWSRISPIRRGGGPENIIIIIIIIIMVFPRV